MSLRIIVIIIMIVDMCVHGYFLDSIAAFTSSASTVS